LFLNVLKAEISENLRFSCALFVKAKLSLLADLNCQRAHVSVKAKARTSQSSVGSDHFPWDQVLADAEVLGPQRLFQRE